MNIIVALDGSDESYESIHLLARLPFSAPPNVRFVAAYSDAGHHSLPEEFRLALVNQLKDEAMQTLNRALNQTKALGWNVSTSLCFGHPKSLIIDKASEFDADLIALGAVGHSAVFRLLLGSTADYVANHAECSVLIARPIEQSKATEKLRATVAYDGSRRANIALSQMAHFDWLHANADLLAVRILERPELLPEDMVFDEHYLNAARNELKDMLDTYPKLKEMKLDVRESTHVANALQEDIVRQNTDLLFLGDTSKSAIGRFFLGSVSRYLLHHLPNSVWIAREKTWSD